ncbi:MAG: hypothetical protein AAF849_20700 [Bacteroidota bacterium]
MKKYIFMGSMLLGVLLCANFTYTTQEVHRILKAMLELEAVQDMLEKEQTDAQFIIVTNDLLPDDFHLFYGDQQIEVLAEQRGYTEQSKDKIIEIIRFDASEQEAHIKFNYGDYRSNIKLRKEEDAWIAQSILIRGAGQLYWLIDKN